MKDILVSIIVPVYNVDLRWLKATIQSVLQQTYPYWQLCIVDDGSSHQEVIDYLRHLQDERIQVLFLGVNRGIASASNAALTMAKGDFVGFLDHDDELTPDALHEIVQIIRQMEPDIVYSDEEYIKTNGSRYSAHFKPD